MSGFLILDCTDLGNIETNDLGWSCRCRSNYLWSHVTLYCSCQRIVARLDHSLHIASRHLHNYHLGEISICTFVSHALIIIPVHFPFNKKVDRLDSITKWHNIELASPVSVELWLVAFGLARLGGSRIYADSYWCQCTYNSPKIPPGVNYGSTGTRQERFPSSLWDVIEPTKQQPHWSISLHLALPPSRPY